MVHALHQGFVKLFVPVFCSQWCENAFEWHLPVYVEQMRGFFGYFEVTSETSWGVRGGNSSTWCDTCRHQFLSQSWSLEALELFPSNQDCLNASMRLNLCELICFKSLKNLQELDGKSKWNRHNRAKSATHFRDVHGCSWMCICRVPGRLSAQVIYKKCPEAVNGGLCRTIDRGTGSRWGQPYTCRPKDKFPGLPEGWESCGRVFNEYLWCISLQIRFNCPAAATKSYSTVGQNVDPHLSC